MIAALGVALLLGGSVVAVGLYFYYQRSVAAPPSPTATMAPATLAPFGSDGVVAQAPDAALPPPAAGGAAAESPLMVPNLGVHLGEPRSTSGAINLATVRAVLQSDLRRFERCRVLGRATRAQVALEFGSEGQLYSMSPMPGRGYDLEASRCVAARFSEAAIGVRFGSNLGGEVIFTADLDAM